MSFWQILWFILIGVLFSGFFFLEGFDYGVGILHLFLGKNKEERDQIMMTIEPVWDGNEVWLITAGGAIFASFPYWYAALFSGFYIPLFIVLAGLILRGVCFAFRHFSETDKAKEIWDKVFGISNIIPPFVLGMIFTAMVSGMPMDAKGNIYASFGDYVTPFSLVGGVAVLLLCLLHGLNYIALKTTGDIRERAHKWAKKLYIVLFAGEVLFAILLYLYTDFFIVHPVSTVVLLVAIIALSVFATKSVHSRHEERAFIASGLTLIAVVALLFTGLFPRVMVSSIDPNYSLLIANASSSEYTLKTMTIVTICVLPIVLAYQAWAYNFFKGRVHKKGKELEK